MLPILKELRRKFYAEWAETCRTYGICITCGDEPRAKTSVARCDRCIERSRKWQKKQYHRKKAEA